MRIIKFNINEDAYETFATMCKNEDITVKKKINVLLAQDSSKDANINDYLPENYDQNLRSITLKVNEELYKGVMKSSDRLDVRAKKFIPYLIYKYIKEN
jgi:hypothetical protein